MHTIKLEGTARNVIDLYLALPFALSNEARPACPYFNNRRSKSKSGLRVLRGKGTPHEIVEEAIIDSLHTRTDLKKLSKEGITEFLVNHGLGVDCSGFAYHIFDALAHDHFKKGIKNFVTSNRRGFWGRIISRIRPAENIGVASFRNDKNSTQIDIQDIRPGDFITFMGTGKDNLYNHIVVVTEVTYAEQTKQDAEKNAKQKNIKRITYAHSYAWPSDGKTGHGVREGSITFATQITPPVASPIASAILGPDVVWSEKGETRQNYNYTRESAEKAREVSIRRLNFMQIVD